MGTFAEKQDPQKPISSRIARASVTSRGPDHSGQSQGRQVNARFGEFTGASNPRQMQFALRFYF